MNKIVILALLLLPASALAAGEDIGLTAHNISDIRTSLGLPSNIRHRQLVNMRSQMLAVQTIIGLLAKENFDKAAKTARTKLGQTDEMKQIYKLSGNEDFRKRGLAFQQSTDKLVAALQTKDMKKSLQALSYTMGFCSQCHNKFRQ